MKSILDPTFRYVPSVQTDLRKTFSRIRREMDKARVAQQADATPNGTRVVVFARPKEFAAQRS